MPATSPRTSEAGSSLPDRQVALIDLLDRLLSGGVVLTGDVVLSIADIDLVRISLRALIMSIRSSEGGGASAGGGFPGLGAPAGGGFPGRATESGGTPGGGDGGP
ncbi:gas vesicle protein [Streptomyces marianii]|uniref:gas vesicle protein n=1 Tax=Streptomyces marianii TaxID=1817406 RepID=UPI001F446741|nr:gas vesicle protein [Streptomyces marianii]